jgi:hypothetical protein
MAKSESTFSLTEYVIIGGVVAASIGLSLALRLSPKWEHGVEFTVLLFAVLIMALRPVWREPFFWRGLAVAFLAHVTVAWLVTRALPSDSRGIRGVPALAIGMIEGLLLLNVLWVSSKRRS